VSRRESRYELVQDRKGMAWDLLLYVPTVVFLGFIALRLSYGPNASWSYLLMFLASLIFLIGANRILKSRLMLLPTAPVAIEIDKERVTLRLRNGTNAVLVKDLRYFSEIGGNTFALTGMDLEGRKQQHVFHVGQFPSSSDFKSAKSLLEVYR
jgi:hypothetical protein